MRPKFCLTLQYKDKPGIVTYQYDSKADLEYNANFLQHHASNFIKWRLSNRKVDHKPVIKFLN